MVSSERPLVIVADDDRASAALLKFQLERAGYAVRLCENGKQALSAICDAGNALAIVDWSMPEMDGLELCRRVRALCNEAAIQFAFLILLTAHSDREEVVQGLEAGADDYLTKPYHCKELLARLGTGQRIQTLQTQLFQRQLDLERANVEMLNLNRKLEQAANTDALTSIANRRYLLLRFAEAWARSERTGEALGCVMFDVDRFKRINDSFGHAAGDEVLRTIARTCHELVRRYDIFGRIGGEEFCVVCPSADLGAVASLGERLREGIAALTILSDGKPIPVTASVGVAIRRPEHTCPGDLLAVADRMLYRAKEAGRNQVWMLDPSGQPQFASGAPLLAQAAS